MGYLGKRISIIALLFTILSVQTYATGLDSVLNGTSVSSDFGTWSSPRTGSKYFYGGSYTFAFKGAGKYQPFFQGEAPSFKVGCNGFSLRGGFIALLGIDEIKFLLKNAGATLAWGLMMGLKYTMPALAAVFDDLRNFARQLQKILQNSCQIGQLIMKNSSFGKKIQGKINEITNGFTGKVNDYFAGKMKGFTDFTEKLEDFNKGVKNGCTGMAPAAYKTCMNKGGETGAAKSKSLALYNSSSIVSYSIGAFATNALNPSNSVEIAKMSSFFSDGKIGNKQLVSDSSARDSIKTTILISRLFFGDFATPHNSFLKIWDYTTGAGKAIAEGSYGIDISKSMEQMKAEVTNQVDKIYEGSAWVSPVISSPEAAAKALIDGITSAANSSLCHKGYCNVEDDYLYYVDLAQTSSGSEKTRVLSSIKSSTTNTLKVEWSGTYEESLKVIRKLVQDKTGYASTYKSMGEASAQTASSFSSVKIPLLLPNINKYLSNIILLEKKAKKETPYTAQLKSLLARYNGYFFATSLIDMITGKIIDALGSKGTPAGNPDIRKMQGYLQNLMKTREAILIKIKDEMKNQISYKNLAEMFEKIDKNIRETQIKGY